MNGKKWITVLCLLLCAVLILPLAGCKEKSAPKPIEFPVEGFTWGMTLEEAKNVLNQKGVVFEENDLNTGKIILGIAPSELSKLNVEKIAGLPLSQASYKPLSMQFDLYSRGVYRLIFAVVNVDIPTEKTTLTTAEAEEVLTEAFDKMYGERPEGVGVWTTYNATLTEKDCEKLSAETLARVQNRNYATDSVYPHAWYTIDEGYMWGVLYFADTDYAELLYGK